MSKYYLTTTGKTNPVILNDLNLSYPHPTSHYDLLLDVSLDKILGSDDLKFCVETNQILLKNDTGKLINLHDITQTSSILAATGSNDYKMKSSSLDLLPDFLVNKLKAGNNITLNEIEENNIKKLEITSLAQDLTPYQLLSEKNQPNGYLGLDSNARNNSILQLEPFQKFYSKLDTILNRQALGSSVVGGCVNYNTSVNNYVSLFADTRRMYGMMGFLLNPLATGYGWTQNISDTFYGLASNSLISSCSIVAIKNSGSVKSFSVIIQMGDQTINASEVLSGDSLFFRFNPTINGGLWQVAKSVGNIKTYYDTNIIPIFDRLNEYTIIYNKATEIAYFYINTTLIYTMVDVGYGNNTILNRVLIATADATETNTERKITIFRSYLEVA